VWPSLIAVVERAEREVVVELGVPLCLYDSVSSNLTKRWTSCVIYRILGRENYGPISEGVPGSEGGGGRLIKVGADIFRCCKNEIKPQIFALMNARILLTQSGDYWCRNLGYD
jgi:hypothetical protein